MHAARKNDEIKLFRKKLQKSNSLELFKNFRGIILRLAHDESFEKVFLGVFLLLF